MRLADALDEALPDLSGGAVASMGSVINRSGIRQLRVMGIRSAAPMEVPNSYAVIELLGDDHHTVGIFAEFDRVEGFLARREGANGHDPEAWDLG